MKLDDFPQEIQARLMPAHAGRMAYRCLGCSARFGIERLLYVCPECGQVLLIEDQDFERLKATPGRLWRRVFDYRKMLDEMGSSIDSDTPMPASGKSIAPRSRTLR